MARPPAPEPVDLRLIDLAAQHIRKFGLARTRIVAIAEEAGMSHANVYRYYPSKQALVDAILDQWLRPIEKSLRDIADGPDPTRDKLERLISGLHRAYRRKLDEDPAIFRLFADASMAGDAMSRRHRNRVFLEIHRVVEEGVSAGSIEASDQRAAVTLLGDAMNRFLQPVQILLDHPVATAEVEVRMERVLEAALRAMDAGRATPKNRR